MFSSRNASTMPSPARIGGMLDPKNQMTRRRKEFCSDEQTNGRDAVRVKIPVENGRFAARMIRQHRRIEREPDERDAQQSDARESQARMRHAMEKPQQCHAFERPADRDPLAMKLDRENQRDEK